MSKTKEELFHIHSTACFCPKSLCTISCHFQAIQPSGNMASLQIFWPKSKQLKHYTNSNLKTVWWKNSTGIGMGGLNSHCLSCSICIPKNVILYKVGWPLLYWIGLVWVDEWVVWWFHAQQSMSSRAIKIKMMNSIQMENSEGYNPKRGIASPCGNQSNIQIDPRSKIVTFFYLRGPDSWVV